jgi:hypothetical protein
MSVLRRSAVSIRLCAMITFLTYLLAGASLALPSELRCTRCSHLGASQTMKPGASCPLSYNGQHCHHDQSKASGKTLGKIALCPDGCLRYDDQGGEIPSLAKFVAVPEIGLAEKLLVTLASASRQIFPEDPFKPPPHRPPILSL